jgi:hypothetical protein
MTATVDVLLADGTSPASRGGTRPLTREAWR